MSDTLLDSNGQLRPPFLTPGDQYSPLNPDQWASQGVGGVPVPQPPPGSPPAYPPGGQGNVGFGLPQEASAGGGFEPRGANESASQYFARKQAAGVPMEPADFMALEAEQLQNQALYGAGGVSSTTTSTSRQNVSPEMRALTEVRSRAVKAAGDRMVQTADEAARTGVTESQLYATRADALQQETAAEQARQQANTSELLRRQTEVDKASKDYVKAAQNIDPNRIMSGGRGVMAAIAMAAGAYGATLGRSQNFAQQIIDHALDRDLSAQQMSLNAKKDGLNQLQQAFQNYRSIYQDDAAARAAVRADARDVFANQLSSVAAKFKGTEAQANILQERDKLLLDSNQLRTQQAALAAGQIQRSTTTQSGAVPGAGTGSIVERELKAAQAAKAYNDAAGKGTEPTTSDESLRNDTAKEVGKWLPVMQQLERLRDLAKKTNAAGRFFGTDNGNAFNSADDAARQAALQAITGANFSPEQKKAFEDMVHRRAWTADDYDKNISNMQSFVANEMQARVSSLHPKLQEQMRKRYLAGKVAPNIVESLMGGQAPQTDVQRGEAAGARSY